MITRRIVHLDPMLIGTRAELGIGAKRKRSKGKKAIPGREVDPQERGESGLEGWGAVGSIYKRVYRDSEKAAHGGY